MTKPNYTSLPFPQGDTDPFIRKCHGEFMSFFHKLKQYDFTTKTYLSIIHTAEKLKNSPENIARMLVEIGLKADKNAFPEKFIDYLKDRSNSDNMVVNRLTPEQKDLIEIWQQTSSQIHLVTNKVKAKLEKPKTRRPLRQQITSNRP